MEISDEEYNEFLKRNISSLPVAFFTAEYEKLIFYNRYLISNIQHLLTGHLISILMNGNYYNILSKLYNVTVTLKKGRIEISDFLIVIGPDKNEEKPEQSVHVFYTNIYYENSLLLNCIVEVVYSDITGFSGISIKSDTIDELSIDNYNEEDIVNNFVELHKIAIKKNKLLNKLIDLLEDLLDIDEASDIINRSVFLIKGDDEDEDKEE